MIIRQNGIRVEVCKYFFNINMNPDNTSFFIRILLRICFSMNPPLNVHHMFHGWLRAVDMKVKYHGWGFGAYANPLYSLWDNCVVNLVFGANRMINRNFSNLNCPLTLVSAVSQLQPILRMERNEKEIWIIGELNEK